LSRIKEIQLKVGECGTNYLKEVVQLIKLVLMNLRTPFNVCISNFRTNWEERKEHGKEYTFESSYGIFITNKHRFLGEGKLGGKH